MDLEEEPFACQRNGTMQRLVVERELFLQKKKKKKEHGALREDDSQMLHDTGDREKLL